MFKFIKEKMSCIVEKFLQDHDLSELIPKFKSKCDVTYNMYFLHGDFLFKVLKIFIMNEWIFSDRWDGFVSHMNKLFIKI